MPTRQEAEAIATVLLDTGPDGTRRACNNPECEKDYRHEGECTPNEAGNVNVENP